MSILRRAALTAAVLFPAWGAVGCTGADNPKIAEAPKYEPPKDADPSKIQGRPKGYGANDRYQKAMEKRDQMAQ